MQYHLAHLPAVQAAIAAAARCNTIEELQQTIINFKEDPLCTPPAMPGRPGTNYDAEQNIMILGKAPASTETETRVPFSGPMGQVLREEANFAGLDIETAWITCACPWKAKDNNPNATLLAISRPFLFREIDLVKPKVIISLGQKADEQLLQKKRNVSGVVGSTWTFTSPSGHQATIYTTWCHAAVGYRRPELASEFRDHLAEAWRLGERKTKKAA